MRRRILIACLGLIGLVGIAAAGGYQWLKAEYHQPGDGLHKAAPAIVMLFAKGTSVRAIAEQLLSRGLIADADRFRIELRLFGGKKPLRAGEYEFPGAASAADIVHILQEGEQVVHKLTLAEGLSVHDAAALLRGIANLDGPLPDPLPPEGTLLPETYHYHHGVKRQDIMLRMQGAMRDVLGRLWAERDRTVPLATPDQALILASIVEKETGVASERARVAAVFLNRLKKGMRLQSDPTVVYGLTAGKSALGRALTRKDLDDPTPFNTYQIDGLPPAPITNPGRAAIAAALGPAKTDALYFVADGSGGHAFARTLGEHNRNVRKWRALQKGNN